MVAIVNGTPATETPLEQQKNLTAGSSLLEDASLSNEVFEERCIQALFPDTQLSDLDTYQLDVLVRFYEHKAAHERTGDLKNRHAELLARLKSRQEKLGTDSALSEGDDIEPDNNDVYDILTDLYILADRFDSTELKKTILEHVRAEFTMRNSTLHMQLLPSFQTVSKAFDNLPKASSLRIWLLYVFSRYWRPSGDSPEQVLARDELPRDFTLELMLVIAERSYWSGGDDGIGNYKWMVVHDTDGPLPNQEDFSNVH